MMIEVGDSHWLGYMNGDSDGESIVMTMVKVITSIGSYL